MHTHELNKIEYYGKKSKDIQSLTNSQGAKHNGRLPHLVRVITLYLPGEHLSCVVLRSNDVLGFQTFVPQKCKSLQCYFVQLVLFRFCFWSQGSCTLLPQTQPHFLSHEPITPPIRGCVAGGVFRCQRQFLSVNLCSTNLNSLRAKTNAVKRFLCHRY